MLDYKREYERWLASDALNADEKAELQAIAGDEKEIESRFYGPLEFGTAGLRGTMKVGLHQMNVHVIRWATQGFADVIAAEGDEAKQKGVTIYEAKAGKTKALDLYQLRMYVDGCALDNKPVDEAILIARYHPPEVRELLDILNGLSAPDDRPYNFRLVTWDEEGIFVQQSA